LRAVVAAAAPSLVLQHWWPNQLFEQAQRVGEEAWIAWGHTGRPLPEGFDAYVVVSEYQAGFQCHLPSERIHRIWNATDLSRFRRRRRRSAGTVRIAMLSRLDHGKFPRRLVDYLPPLQGLDACLLIAGRGRRRYEIEPELVGRGRHEVVQFVGAIPSASVPAFLSDMDIGLHLNEAVEECASVAVVEMLAAGLPVVGQPDGCMPEMVGHGVNGFLATEARDIAAHLQDLILSHTLRRRMSAASRRRASAYDARRFRASVRALAAQFGAISR
jgi:glycosyltransferase involved in cell wall biosynthesis